MTNFANSIGSKKPILSMILLMTIIFSFSNPLNVFAIHISKPIPYLKKTEFLSNETIDLQGWIKYDREHASDVWVQVSLEKQLNTLTSKNVTSNANGNFSATLSIPDGTEDGNYTVSVLSPCQKIHDNICINQLEEIPITIKNSE
jgi:hypothetical protein